VEGRKAEGKGGRGWRAERDFRKAWGVMTRIEEKSTWTEGVTHTHTQIHTHRHACINMHI
jgi:hypothetical protein